MLTEFPAVLTLRWLVETAGEPVPEPEASTTTAAHMPCHDCGQQPTSVTTLFDGRGAVMVCHCAHGHGWIYR